MCKTVINNLAPDENSLRFRVVRYDVSLVVFSIIRSIRTFPICQGDTLKEIKRILGAWCCRIVSEVLEQYLHTIWYTLEVYNTDLLTRPNDTHALFWCQQYKIGMQLNTVVFLFFVSWYQLQHHI